MKVSGYAVWQFEDGQTVCHDLEIDTTGVFVTVRYGDVVVDTPNPVCRDMYDHLLTTVREQASPLVGSAD